MSGIITGPQFKAYFKQPDSYHIGTMVAILEVGAFSMSYSSYPPMVFPANQRLVTSIAAGRVADIIGRRKTLFSGAVVFVVGGAIQSFTNGFEMMVLGRIFSGFGVGLLS